MGCSNCGSSSNGCSCSNPVNAVSQPPYTCAPACPEDHTNTVCIEKHSAVVKITNSWNIPDCGESAVLVVPDVCAVHIGSYIWSSEYGYFEVIGYNRTINQITIKNNCHTDNADVGTEVPAGSSFIFTSPPSDALGGQSSIFPYVAVDFTAPAEGVPLLITLTNVNGLSVGKSVQIGGSTYLVTAVNSSTNITIENTGSGATAGYVYEALNAADELQYPVVQIDSNPCTNDAELSGSLIVCNNGIMQPLEGSTLGSVPVLTDIDDNLVEFRILDLPTRTCATINDCCLTLTPGQASYTIPVSDSSIFQVGDLIQLGSRTDRFTITHIIDDNHISATISEAPGSVETVPAGTSVCLAGCCEVVSDQLDDILTAFGGAFTPCSDMQNHGGIAAPSGTEVLGTLSEGGTLSVQRFATFTHTNPSTCRNKRAILVAPINIRGTVTNSQSQDIAVIVKIEYSLNGAAYVNWSELTYFARSNSNVARPFSVQPMFTNAYVIPPNTVAYTVTLRVTVTWASASPSTGIFDITDFEIPGVGVGFAV